MRFLEYAALYFSMKTTTKFFGPDHASLLLPKNVGPIPAQIVSNFENANLGPGLTCSIIDPSR